MTPETEAKIKRDAEAYAKEQFPELHMWHVDPVVEAIVREHSAGAKPWAEMCEELERDLLPISEGVYYYTNYAGEPAQTPANRETLMARAERALSKLRAFREGKHVE